MLQFYRRGFRIQQAHLLQIGQQRNQPEFLIGDSRNRQGCFRIQDNLSAHLNAESQTFFMDSSLEHGNRGHGIIPGCNGHRFQIRQIVQKGNFRFRNMIQQQGFHIPAVMVLAKYHLIADFHLRAALPQQGQRVIVPAVFRMDSLQLPGIIQQHNIFF